MGRGRGLLSGRSGWRGVLPCNSAAQAEGRGSSGCSRVSRRVVVAAQLLLTSLVWATVDPNAAPTAPLPDDLRASLATVVDFAPNFDHPAYYALLAWVKRQDDAMAGATPIDLDDWSALAERPSEFRGLPLMIDGYVGRNKAPYVHVGRRELGRVWQLELYRPSEPIKATVICTTDVGDAPPHSRIRVAGYFVMMRKYRDAQNRDQYAALLVAQGPTLIERAAATATPRGFDWRWAATAGALGLGLAWVWLRMATRGGGRRPTRTLHATREPPMNLADDVADWAADDPPDKP